MEKNESSKERRPRYISSPLGARNRRNKERDIHPRTSSVIWKWRQTAQIAADEAEKRSDPPRTSPPREPRSSSVLEPSSRGKNQTLASGQKHFGRNQCRAFPRLVWFSSAMAPHAASRLKPPIAELGIQVKSDVARLPPGCRRPAPPGRSLRPHYQRFWSEKPRIALGRLCGGRTHGQSKSAGSTRPPGLAARPKPHPHAVVSARGRKKKKFYAALDRAGKKKKRLAAKMVWAVAGEPRPRTRVGSRTFASADALTRIQLRRTRPGEYFRGLGRRLIARIVPNEAAGCSAGRWHSTPEA